MTAVKDMDLGHRADLERDALRFQLKNAQAQLEAIDLERAELAIAVVHGDAGATYAMQLLEAEAAGRRRDVETFTLALQSFDRARLKAQEAQQTDRVAKTNERRQKLIDNAYAEQAPQMEATIKRFEACGEKQQALVWRNALSNLRRDLEKQFPVIGRKPTTSKMIGAQNAA